MAVAATESREPETLLERTFRSLTSTVNSEGRPTADITEAEAAMPVQRRVSVAEASATVATAMLRFALEVEKPTALSVLMEPFSLNTPPAPTKRFIPESSTARTRTFTGPVKPVRLTPVCTVRLTAKAPEASTKPLPIRNRACPLNAWVFAVMAEVKT